MKYVVNRNNKKFKLQNYKFSIDGIIITPKNDKDSPFVSKKITITDTFLQSQYIKKKIDRKLNTIIQFMLKILNDEDTTEGDSDLVLGEIDKLKGIIINKYKKYMKESEYKAILTKLILISEEFTRNYNEHIYNNYGQSNYYEEEVYEGMKR